MPLAVPSGDDRIADRQVGQRQQSRTITDTFDIRGGDVPESAVPEDKVASVLSSIEIGEFSLLRGARAVGAGA
jgi:hypothetical protein